MNACVLHAPNASTCLRSDNEEWETVVKISNMDKYYQALGLNPGASEEEIKEAYRDLVNVWHPDRFSNDSRLKEKASEKLREINLAYEVLKAYIAGKSESFRAMGERGTRADSQPPPREPPPKSEKEETTSTSDKDDGSFQPPPEQPFGQTPPHVSPPKQEKETISHSPLMWFFMMFGAGIGYLITKQMHFSPNMALIYGGGIPAILGCVGGLVGIGIANKINKIKKPKKYKIRLAWAVSIAGIPLFFLISVPAQMMFYGLSPSTIIGKPQTSSSVISSSTTHPEDSTSKEHPFLTYLRKKERDELNKDAIWKLMAKDSQGSTFSYDTKYIVRLGNGVGVWTKTVYGDKAISRKTTQSGGNYEKVAFSLELNDIDCMQQIARRLEVFHYSEEGVCIDYSKTPSEWISVPPNTVLEVLQKEVCR